jgi:hypothetical protein
LHTHTRPPLAPSFHSAQLGQFHDTRATEIAARAEQLKRQQAAEEAAWQAKLAEINARANARPLLVEFEAQERERLRARRKTLAAVRAQLQASGVDYRAFFEPSELIELEQMEIDEQIQQKLSTSMTTTTSGKAAKIA